MIHYIFALSFALFSNITIETSFQSVNVELNKKNLKPEIPLHKIPQRKTEPKEIPKINITPRQDAPAENIHVAGLKKVLNEKAQEEKNKESVLIDDQEAERRAYAIFILRQQMAANKQFKYINPEEYQQQMDATIPNQRLSLETGGIFTFPLRVGINILRSVTKSFTAKSAQTKQKKGNLPPCLKIPNQEDLSVYLKMLEQQEESEKTKYINLIKDLIKKDLSTEIANYNIELDNTQLCIYTPTNHTNSPCVYIPTQNNNPAHIYIPSKNDNPHCFYIPTEKEKDDLIVSSVPVIVIAGGGAGGVIGGILSGPAIPIITVGIGIGFLIKGFKDKKNNSSSGGSGGGSNNNNKKNDDDDEEKKRKQKETEKFKIEHPNGEYDEGSSKPKHHINARGKASKGPSNGQKTLDGAVDVEGTDYKVGTEGQNIIVFREHLPGKWHGYIVENPCDDVKKTLLKQGWIRATNNLKIIRK
jgi:hypothetical protein